jgi:hypothetical protein
MRNVPRMHLRGGSGKIWQSNGTRWQVSRGARPGRRHKLNRARLRALRFIPLPTGNNCLLNGDMPHEEAKRGGRVRLRTRHSRADHGHRWHMAARLHHSRGVGSRCIHHCRGAGCGPELHEFFLLLSSTGLAYRRCKLDRVNGDRMAVRFLWQREKQKKEPVDHLR